MNDARRQLLHEAYKLLDVGLMVMAFMLAIWIQWLWTGQPATPPAPSNPMAVESMAVESMSVGSMAPGEAEAPLDAGAGAEGGAWAEGEPGGQRVGDGQAEDVLSADIPAAADDVPLEPLGAEPGAEPPGADAEPGAPSTAAGEPSLTPEQRQALRPEGRPGRPSTAVALEDENWLSRGISYLPSNLVTQLERLESALFADPDGPSKLLGFVIVAFLSIFAWYASFSSQGLYNSRRLDSPLRESLDVIRGGAFGSAMVVVLTTSHVKERLPGGEDDVLRFAMVFFLLATGTSVVCRLLIRSVLTRLRLRGRNLRGILVIGTNHRALRFASSLEKKRELGYYVVGFVDEHWDGIAGFKQGGGRLVARLEDLGSYLANHVVDEVVVALPVSSAYVHSSRIVSLCTEQGITVRFVSQIFDQRLAKGKLDVFDGEPMLSLEGVPEAGFPKVIKALFDRLAAAFLLLCISPLLIPVALAIKLTSPDGPVLFVQRRVGLNKRMFDVYKFRTMVPNAEAKLKEIEHLNQVSGPVFKIDKDPRLTPIGEFLRKTSIDELPQLLNVLKGDMSLVGPRPLPERDYKGFDKDSHRRRLSVRPGITCTWQVSGRNSIPFEEWMKMDLEYIDEWSLWLDFKILLKTIPVVLGPLLFRREGEFMKGKAVAEDQESGKKGSSAAKAEDQDGETVSPRGPAPKTPATGIDPEAMASNSSRGH